MENQNTCTKLFFLTNFLKLQLNLTKSLSILPNLKPSSWNEECQEKIEDYFHDPSRTILTIYFQKGKLKAQLDFPNESTDNGLVYFIREQYQVLQPDNFLSNVLFGTFNDRIENGVLRIMEGLFAPFTFKYEEWPEGILSSRNFMQFCFY